MASNAWHRFRYTLWAPYYDRVTKFPAERRHALGLLDLRAGERLLIIGCGTGADLPFVPPEVEVLAVDLTAAMLAQARAHARPGVTFRQMDALRLDLPDGDAVSGFDAAILHMVLEVVPDPARCLAEAARVLKVGGRLSVFDKFVPDGSRPSGLRRAALALLDLVFTSTKHQFADIFAGARAPCEFIHDEPSVGAYRQLVLRRR